MITLDPTLATAQDSMNRQPIVKIESKSFADSIPFEGNEFNTGTLNERNPDIIEMESGRLAAVIERNDDLILLITDTDKTEWSEYTIYNPGSVDVLLGSIVETADNNLGIILIDKPSNYQLRSLVVDTAGAVVTAAATILSTSYWIDSPSVVLLANGTYLLTYNYKNGSNEYSIQSRTSSDFATWSSASTIAPSGLTNTKRIDNATVRQLTSGDIFLLFDYQNDISADQELVNIYAMISDDNGATWGTPEKLTDYTVYGTIGQHPSIAERADGSVEISFQEEMNILTMNTGTTNWCSNISGTPDMYYNPSTEKIYAKQIYTGGGVKTLRGIVIIDVPTWTIDKCYSTTSTPAINSLFNTEDVWYRRTKDDGKYCVVGTHDGEACMVLDVEADTITNYCINADQSAYGLTKNVDIDMYRVLPVLWHVDADSDRLYIAMADQRIFTINLHWGYIDLTEQPDEITGMYTYTELGDYSKDIGHFTVIETPTIDVANDLLMLPMTYGAYTTGRLFVMDLDGGGLLKDYVAGSYPDMQQRGCYDPIYHNGHIYAGTTYTSGYGDENYYGLMDIDYNTDVIVYHRPSYATADDYGLKDKKIIDTDRILMDADHGVVIFDIATQAWTLYNSTSLPGIPETSFWAVDYDPVEQQIFVGGNTGVAAFNESGNFQQLKYITGTYAAGWSYAAAAVLAQEYVNSEAAIVIDSADTLWALWSHRDITEYSTWWDQESAEKDLTEYLTNDPVTATWDIESPASLSFSLSHGHLFDPSNSMSILAQFTKKGRKIELQFGETVDGTDYLQDQGFFIVDDTSLSYERGNYPVIKINCEDYRAIWKQAKIPVTDFFSDEDPEDIIQSLLEDHAEIATLDIDMPTFTGTHTLYHQFIDQYLSDMLQSIFDHFNYFFYVSMTGKFTAKEFNLTGSVDHAYTGTELINYTPDDSFSSFINRIIVKGEGRYELEVLMPCEIVGTLAGTCGWWGGEEVHRVWYSDDHEKKCRDPYLEINTSIQEFQIFTIKGGGKEYISATDVDEYYVEITIEAPDLLAVFLATTAAILAVGTAALTCGDTTGKKCGPYIFALTILTQIMGYLLGSIAQYDYEIWANPIGQTKQTFQADADDLVFQRQLNGLIVSDEIDDPFCYTIAQCQTVAGNELALVMAQRNRVSFSKLAHLQDEIGDILQIVHPYTELDLSLFTTTLKRIYQKGEKSDGIFDNIQGWLL